MINDPVDGVERDLFILWYVSLMLKMILVMFEHVWGKNRLTGIASGDIQSEVTVFINSRNLVWAAPDSLQFLSKVLLKGSSLVNDEVTHLKCDVCVPTLLCIFELFVSGHDKVIMVCLMG